MPTSRPPARRSTPPPPERRGAGAAPSAACAPRASARCAAPPAAMIGRSTATQLSADTASATRQRDGDAEHEVQRQQPVAAQEHEHRDVPEVEAVGDRAEAGEHAAAEHPPPRRRGRRGDDEREADGRERVADRSRRASSRRRRPHAGTAVFATASQTTSAAPAANIARRARALGVRPYSASAASMPIAKYGSIAASVLENVIPRPRPAIDAFHATPSASSASGTSACARRRGGSLHASRPMSGSSA